MELERIIQKYTDEPVRDVSALGGGHINRSFLVTGDERYVLQSINPGLYKEHLDALSYNYEQ